VGDSEDFDRTVRGAISWCHDLYRSGNRGADVIRAFEERIRAEPDLATLKALRFMLDLERAAQRKRALAEAAGRPDPVDEMFRWISVVDRIMPGISRFDRITPGMDRIAIIQARLNRERDAAVRRELNLILAHQYTILFEFTVSETIYLELFHDEAEDPIPLIKLAEQKFYFEQLYEAAIRIIDQAVDVAYRSGNFRRNALSVKARIALGMKDYKTVEGVLQEIMALEFEPGNVDTGIMRDFFERLPPDSIDRDVASRYGEHSRFPL
jgi:hypothetical protein